MNVYIWERLEAVTGNWHSAAGVVIVASTIDAAQCLAEQQIGPNFKLTQPDRVIPCGGNEEPKVFIFPDAGCC